MFFAAVQDLLRLRLFEISCRDRLVFGAVAIALWCMSVRSTPPDIFNG